MKRFYNRNRPGAAGVVFVLISLGMIVLFFQESDWRFLLISAAVMIAAVGMFLLEKPYWAWVNRRELKAEQTGRNFKYYAGFVGFGFMILVIGAIVLFVVYVV